MSKPDRIDTARPMTIVLLDIPFYFLQDSYLSILSTRIS